MCAFFCVWSKLFQQPSHCGSASFDYLLISPLAAAAAAEAAAAAAASKRHRCAFIPEIITLNSADTVASAALRLIIPPSPVAAREGGERGGGESTEGKAVLCRKLRCFQSGRGTGAAWLFNSDYLVEEASHAGSNCLC